MGPPFSRRRRRRPSTTPRCASGPIKVGCGFFHPRAQRNIPTDQQLSAMALKDRVTFSVVETFQLALGPPKRQTTQVSNNIAGQGSARSTITGARSPNWRVKLAPPRAKSTNSPKVSTPVTTQPNNIHQANGRIKVSAKGKGNPVERYSPLRPSTPGERGTVQFFEPGVIDLEFFRQTVTWGCVTDVQNTTQPSTSPLFFLRRS
jgi:hypothetical protein